MTSPNRMRTLERPPIDLVIGKLRGGGFDPNPSGRGQWKSRCPAHDGKSRNLSIKEADDGRVVLHCHHVDEGGRSCPPESIVRAIGLEMADLFPPKQGRPPGKPKAPARSDGRNGDGNGNGKGKGKAWRSPEDIASWKAGVEGGCASEPWIYRDADGHELMRVYRFDKADGGKLFLPVHHDHESWYMGDPPGPLPLYHLDELAAADTVFVLEGEKCADLVRKLGLVATTSSHGSGSAHRSDWAPLAGKTVVMVPDHDAAGEGYIAVVGEVLSGLDPRPVVKVLRLPLEGDGDDVEQWLDSAPDSWGPDECAAGLVSLAAGAPDWKASANPLASDDNEEGEGGDVKDPIGDVDPRAFHGVLGRLALLTQPETEANPLFVLLHLLAFFGAGVGRKPHFVMSASRHHMNLFFGLIGMSGISRKGTAGQVAKAIWRKTDAAFADENITDGLNSGAGLLYHLRDASQKPGPKGQAVEDAGIIDKRRVFLEEEFSSVLKQGHRESDPLLDYLRKMWDGQDVVHSKTKDPTKVTGGHVSIVGHCTPADLEIYLSDADKANGTANRILWFFGVRSKLLPKGGDVFGLLADFLGADLGELEDAIAFARGVDRIRRSPEVEARWEKLYREFNEIPPGRLGAFFVRAPVQVMRIASIFALADRRAVIEGPHLDAALAIWEQSARSLRFIFKADVDPLAEKLLKALKEASPEGLSKKQISVDVFKRNRDASSIDDLLTRLLAYRLIVRMEAAKGARGRPAPRFCLNAW